MAEKEIDINPYKTLKSLLEVTTSYLGKDFLRVLSNELKKLLLADLVFITKPLDHKPTTKVEILYSTNEQVPKSFKLENTPCKLVYDNNIYKQSSNVSKCFKGSIGKNFESFYGVPLTNKKNECVGHIAIFFKTQRSISKEIENVILLFAKKIEVEYERELLEQENKKIREELEKLTITDSLTNLYNRRYFDMFANDILNQVKRLHYSATLSFIDIDDFKKLNDTYGHKIGDKVLKYLSDILLGNARKGIEHVFRIGGEEFAIISINTTIKQSLTYLNRVNKELKEKPYSKNIFLTLSIGLDSFEVQDKTIDKAYKRADDKMYIAKNRGKDSIEV